MQLPERQIDQEELSKQEANILGSYLPSLEEQDQSDFIKKYKTLKQEERNLILQRIMSMMPEFRNQQEPDSRGLDFSPKI